MRDNLNSEPLHSTPFPVLQAFYSWNLDIEPSNPYLRRVESGKKFNLIALIITSTFILSNTPILAEQIIGTPCSRLGSKRVSFGQKYNYEYRCSKDGKKLTWQLSDIKFKPNPVSKKPSPVNSAPESIPSITLDYSKDNQTRFRIDSLHRVVLECNGSLFTDPKTPGKFLLLFSTSDAVNNDDIFTNESYLPRNWLGPKLNYLFSNIPYLALENSTKPVSNNWCGFTSEPIPEIVKYVASDIKTIGLFYQKDVQSSGLVKLGSILLNKFAFKSDLIVTNGFGIQKSYRRVWCLIHDPYNLISKEKVLSDLEDEQGNKLDFEHFNSKFSSETSPKLPSSFSEYFKARDGIGWYHDLTSAEQFKYQGKNLQCKFTGTDIFGAKFEALRNFTLPNNLFSLDKQKKFVVEVSRQDELDSYNFGDNWIKPTIRCEVESLQSYNQQTSTVSIINPRGEILITRKMELDRFWASYIPSIKEAITNANKSYYCSFNLTSLDGQTISERYPVVLPNVVKDPIPIPQVVIQARGKGSHGQAMCLLKNWKDYSLGEYVKISNEVERFQPKSTISLLRDDGSLVKKSGVYQVEGRFLSPLLNFPQMRYAMGLFFDIYEYSAEIDRASSKIYMCKYELVGFDGQIISKIFPVQMPWQD